jgi:hypothetical protein
MNRVLQSASDVICPDFARRGVFVPRNRSASPDRDKREKENSSTRHEDQRKTCVHDTLPGDDRVHSRFNFAATLVSAQPRF